MNSIKRKILLFVVVVMFLLPLVFGLYFIREHYILDERVAESVDATFQVLNTTLVQDMKNAMLANQIHGIQESLLSIKIFKQIRSAVLLDSEGKVVIGDRGVFIRRGEREIFSETAGNALQDAFAKSKVQLHVQKNPSFIFYQYLVPFKNELKCRGCHGHLEKTNGILVLRFQVPDVRRQTHRLMFITFGFYIAGILLASLMLLFLIQNIVVSPLYRMQNAMRQVSGGDLAVKIPVERGDEVGQLSHYFNDMVQKLKDAQDALEKSVEEKEKAKFLAEIGMMASKVAHEVRNPLNVLEGVAYYLKKAYSGEQDVVEHATLIQNKVKHLERFSNDLLLFAKPEQLNAEDVGVNALAARKVQEFLQFNNEKKVRISLLLSPDAPQLSLDMHKFNEAIENLLQNAYDASPEESEITVSTRKEGARVTVSVKDKGSGIPENQKGNLFTPFFSTKKTGTGLGLCIVKKIMEAHDGEIRITSEENKGTEVQLIFKGGAS